VSGLSVRVLVVDDSAANRRTLAELLEAEGDVEVVERAVDGEQGLRKAQALEPDVITLDLEMPRLDGFAFLRLLLAQRPVPVVVISSYSHRTDVFRALELGAVDFIAKPAGSSPEQLAAFGQELREKVRAARLARRMERRFLTRTQPELPVVVVGLGASTGGPPAIQQLLEATAGEPSLCFLISQHMPPHFTRAFAERLDRMGGFRVSEATDGDVPQPGRAFIAPGGRQLVLARGSAGPLLRTLPRHPEEKHAPSVDKLFESMAAVLGPRALGVVLTGMGSDGARGARALHAAGGEVWAEAEESAVIFGMPQEAIATGVVRRVLSLGQLGPALRVHARRRR
jgi:two-component system chemotaxis response regulator CheB